jgi:preprotein translocase subunit SecG
VAGSFAGGRERPQRRTRGEEHRSAMEIALSITLVVTSLLLVVLILLHRGKGGGLSSMFGGGVSNSLAGSSIAEKNLDRFTIAIGVIWFACIIGLGLLLKAAAS